MIDTGELKKIPIQEYLASQGFAPVRQAGGRIWYHSPLRDGDKTPSFTVDMNNNRWYDFAMGEGGSIIDLALRLSPSSSYVDVLKKLQEFTGFAGSSPSIIPVRKNETSSVHRFKLEHISPVHEVYRLTEYLDSRSISCQTAEEGGVKVAFYSTASGAKRFALAFLNDEGGYELRNSCSKGTLGTKAITTIPGKNPGQLCIFEGFMDYLSYRQCNPDYKGGYLILNSAALVNYAIEKITSDMPNTSEISLFLDNDSTGNIATEKLTTGIQEKMPACSISDRRSVFAPYNDYNEYLQARSKQQTTQQIQSNIWKQPQDTAPSRKRYHSL